MKKKLPFSTEYLTGKARNKVKKNLLKEFKKNSNPEKALFLQRFFKTGKGEYAEGDKLLGINVPVLRKLAKKYYPSLALLEIKEMLLSVFHEIRLTALFILCHQYEESNEEGKKCIFDFYLENTSAINNWDLVDTSAHKIMGDYLLEKDKSILFELTKSPVLWERRIAIITTFHFIKKEQFETTIDLATLLLKDKEDLIHKAAGWMLREVGKREKEILIDFLKEHSLEMPRIMLRYAIEKFPPEERKAWLERK